MSDFSHILLAALYSESSGNVNNYLRALFLNGANHELMIIAVRQFDICPYQINRVKHLAYVMHPGNVNCILWYINWTNIKWSDLDGHYDKTRAIKSMFKLSCEHMVKVINALEIPIEESDCIGNILDMLSDGTNIKTAQRVIDSFKITAVNASKYNHMRAIEKICVYGSRIEFAQWWVNTFEITDENIMKMNSQLHVWEGPLVKCAY